MFEKEAEEYAKQKEIERNNLECIIVVNYEVSRSFKDGAEFGYNKAKEEMQKNGLALQSDMDKTIEQNIALKAQLAKLKSCSNCIHYSSTFELCHYSMGDEDYDCRGRKWEIKENG